MLLPPQWEICPPLVWFWISVLTTTFVSVVIAEVSAAT